MSSDNTISNAELDDINFGKAVERLYENIDFQNVILKAYMDDRALSIAKNFTTGSKDDIEALNGIASLHSFLFNAKEQCKILQSQYKTRSN